MKEVICRSSRFGFFIIFSIYLLSISSINAREDDIKPVVGIVTNPKPYDSDNTTESLIYYNYVVWLESYGLKTVPILYDYSKRDLDILLSKVNGVLFQGGYRSLRKNGLFENQSEYIMNKATELHKPIWFTCQGFELLFFLLTGQDKSVLSLSDSMDLNLPIEIDNNNIKSSKMFSFVPQETLQSSSNIPSTAHFHGLSVRPSAMDKWPALKEILIVTSYGTGNDKLKFINSVESKDFNKNKYFAVQFHPEKIGFSKSGTEIKYNNIYSLALNHSIGLSFYNELVREKDMSKASFSDDDQKKWGVFLSSEYAMQKDSRFYWYNSSTFDGTPSAPVQEEISVYVRITIGLVILLGVVIIYRKYQKSLLQENKSKCYDQAEQL
jgi:gamma-glutamyl-gamma-aminobutyrate hydrolase PuuD